MRKALGLVLALGMATHAFADEPPQPAPVPAQAPEGPPTPAQPPADPAVDPAYGERPDPHESATRAGPNEEPGMRAGRDIVVRYHPDRSRNSLMIVGALAGAAVVFGAVGLYYHLDSRDATDAVAAKKFTSMTWTPARQETYDRAHDSAAIAKIAYGIGAGFLIATIVAYIVTEPPQETMTIHPHTNPVQHQAIVAPIPGGALVAKGWTF